MSWYKVTFENDVIISVELDIYIKHETIDFTYTEPNKKKSVNYIIVEAENKDEAIKKAMSLL